MPCTEVATNEIERSGQMCNILKVGWIVHTVMDCERIADKESEILDHILE